MDAAGWDSPGRVECGVECAVPCVRELISDLTKQHSLTTAGAPTDREEAAERHHGHSASSERAVSCRKAARALRFEAAALRRRLPFAAA